MEQTPQESELQNKIDAEQKLDAAVEEVKAKVPVIEMQHVIITLADGRRGVFMGPALIKKIEMDLNAVPRLVSIDFDPPKVFSANPAPVEETPNADQKTDDKPAAGLE